MSTVETGTMTYYDVVVIDEAKAEWIFRCWGEDADHATEQALCEPTVREVKEVRLATATDGLVVYDESGNAFSIPGPFTNMNQVREANHEISSYWFSSDTMRFFDSRVESDPIRGRCFISSEQFHGSRGNSGPRLYTVRIVTDDGRVETAAPGFQTFESRAEAINWVIDNT